MLDSPQAIAVAVITTKTIHVIRSNLIKRPATRSGLHTDSNEGRSEVFKVYRDSDFGISDIPKPMRLGATHRAAQIERAALRQKIKPGRLRCVPHS